MLPSLLAIPMLLLAPSHVATVAIEADRDTTLIESPDGSLGNGAGPYLFSGRTNQSTDGVRRALLHFDVAAALPRGAAVEKAVLVLTVTPGNVGERLYRLYPVLDDWGEGASTSGGGGGAPAEPGDATWIHTFHDDHFWPYNGGRFLGVPSAEAAFDLPGVYRFESDELTRDVRYFAQLPGRNHGWILIGDETERQTVKAFASRENPDPAVRPVLEITYRTRP